MWLTLAVFSALTLGGYEVTKKRALNDNAVFPVLFLNVLFGVLIFLPFQVLSTAGLLSADSPVYIPSISKAAQAAIFLKAVLVLSSWVFAYFAMKHLPIIFTTSIKVTQPAFTLIGAILIFFERLNPYQWAGILLSITVLILFSSVGKREGIRFRRNRWIGAIFLATVLGAISSLWDKHLVLSFDRVAIQVYTAYYQMALMIPIMGFLWKSNRKKSETLQWRWSILWATVFLTVSDFLYFYLLSMDGSLISVVSTIRKGGVIVPFLAGAVWFREKDVLRKGILLAVVLARMLLLYFRS